MFLVLGSWFLGISGEGGDAGRELTPKSQSQSQNNEPRTTNQEQTPRSPPYNNQVDQPLEHSNMATVTDIGTLIARAPAFAVGDPVLQGREFPSSALRAGIRWGAVRRKLPTSTGT